MINANVEPRPLLEVRQPAAAIAAAAAKSAKGSLGKAENAATIKWQRKFHSLKSFYEQSTKRVRRGCIHLDDPDSVEKRGDSCTFEGFNLLERDL